MKYALIDTQTGERCSSIDSPPNSKEAMEILANLFSITTGHKVELREVKE